MFSWRCFPLVESAPRAYRLKASNAAPASSTSTGTFPAAAPTPVSGLRRLGKHRLLERRLNCGEACFHLGAHAGNYRNKYNGNTRRDQPIFNRSSGGFIANESYEMLHGRSPEVKLAAGQTPIMPKHPTRT